MNWDDAYDIAPIHRLWPGAGMPLVLEFILKNREAGFERILDAGCGDGRHLSEMVRNCFPLVIGCDGSWRALESCYRRLQSDAPTTADQVVLMRTCLENLLLSNACVDAAVCVDAMVHNRLEVNVRILRELLRCVRFGGRVLFNLCTDQEPIRDLNGIEPITTYSAWYTVQPGGPRFYYEFYDEERLYYLLHLAKIPLGRVKIQRARWKDEPHVGFREYEHEHDGWFVEFDVSADYVADHTSHGYEVGF